MNLLRKKTAVLLFGLLGLEATRVLEVDDVLQELAADSQLSIGGRWSVSRVWILGDQAPLGKMLMLDQTKFSDIQKTVDFLQSKEDNHEDFTVDEDISPCYLGFCAMKAVTGDRGLLHLFSKKREWVLLWKSESAKAAAFHALGWADPPTDLDVFRHKHDDECEIVYLANTLDILGTDLHVLKETKCHPANKCEFTSKGCRIKESYWNVLNQKPFVVKVSHSCFSWDADESAFKYPRLKRQSTEDVEKVCKTVFHLEPADGEEGFHVVVRSGAPAGLCFAVPDDSDSMTKSGGRTDTLTDCKKPAKGYYTVFVRSEAGNSFNPVGVESEWRSWHEVP